ncbi:MAG: AAA family ATPase [Desulfovibrio sp.]|nr:AAA family ATPase [Desulfovibrio sp.]
MSFSAIADINRIPYGDPHFANIRERGSIYVDKTKLIYKIASQCAPLFFSRPRRFGKSLLINTLHCLFSSGLKYFQGLDIEKTWQDKNYKVVHLDFSAIGEKTPSEFKRALGDTIIEEFDVKGVVAQYDEMGVRDPDRIFNEIARKLTNNSVVLLIDEYDAPITHHLDKPDELEEMISLLNSFYATVKQYTGKFRLIFITGVTRTSHISIFSAFNNILDISLDEEFNTLLGFTQDDLIRYFDVYVEKAALDLKIPKSEVYYRLEKYYDGFQFSLDAKETVYNPWSILSFFKRTNKGFQDYWFNSGGVSSIIMQYLKASDSFDLMNYDDREIYVNKDELTDRYEITNIPREILLYQTGYLTIRKITDNTARLEFSNAEVENSLLRLYLRSNNFKTPPITKIKIDEIYQEIDKKNILSIVSIFNDILNDCVSILSKIFQDERSVRDIIYAALPQYIYLQKIKERETLKGFSDLELLTQKTHMVIEFKRTTPTKDAASALQEAIQQIQRKNYGAGAYHHLELFRVAMVISTEEKAILPEFCKEVL